MVLTGEQAKALFESRSWVKLAVKNGATTEVFFGRVTILNLPNSVAIMVYREGEDVNQARHLGWTRLEDMSLLKGGS